MSNLVLWVCLGLLIFFGLWLGDRQGEIGIALSKNQKLIRRDLDQLKRDVKELQKSLEEIKKNVRK